MFRIFIFIALIFSKTPTGSAMDHQASAPPQAQKFLDAIRKQENDWKKLRTQLFFPCLRNPECMAHSILLARPNTGGTSNRTPHFYRFGHVLDNFLSLQFL